MVTLFGEGSLALGPECSPLNTASPARAPRWRLREGCWVCLGALLCSVGRLEEEAERGRASLRTGRAKSGSCGPKESKPSFLTETPPPPDSSVSSPSPPGEERVQGSRSGGLEMFSCPERLHWRRWAQVVTASLLMPRLLFPSHSSRNLTIHTSDGSPDGNPQQLSTWSFPHTCSGNLSC